MSVLWIINGILLTIVLAMVFNELYLKTMVKRSAKTLTGEEFKETMHRVRMIDVREKDIFGTGYILGARSMPYNILKTTIGSLHKDQPVYLYDQEKILSIRVTGLLREDGYTDIYTLKGGYDGRTGKVKKRNS